jgi:PAS domain S-box-containing protein
MKIRSKLLISNLVIALLVAMLGALAANGLTSIDHVVMQLSNEDMPHQQALHDTRFAASRMVSATIEYSALLQRSRKNGGVQEQLLSQEAEQRHESVVLLREASARLQRLSPHQGTDAKTIKNLTSHGEALIASGDALVVAAEQSSLAETDLRRDRYEDEEVAFFRLLELSVDAEQRFVVAKQSALEQRVEQARQWILFLATVVLLLAIGIGWGVAKAIIGRIEQLRQGASRFAHEDDPGRLAVSGNDELSDLAEALNRMAGDLRQSRQEVVDGRDFLFEVINSMADALVVLDAAGKIVVVNAATHAMLGYESELIGLPIDTIMTDPPLDEVAERGILWNVEAEFLNKSGSAIPVAFSCSVLWNPDSSLRGYVCVALDITQIKEAESKLKRYAEELQLNNDELRNFAYIVSHDLRAPLVNIKGFAGELQELLHEMPRRCALEKVSGQGKEWLHQVFGPESDQALTFISSSVTRMEGLIAGLLKLSRYGQRDLHPEEVDTGEVIQQLLGTIGHQLVERQATVDFGPMPVVVADRVAMEQIFANLLDNAVKYLEPARPGLIRVGAEISGQIVTFQIGDNGRGIAHPDLDRIFDIFRRAGRQDVPGEGMGLAYVRTLVKRLGGNIWCESKVGSGTTFFVTLPCRVVSPEAPT